MKGIPMTKRKAFLCHSSQDKAKVERIAQVLAEVGIPVWYDNWEIGWGDSVIEKIQQGLEASSDLIVFLSNASLSSPWVQHELSSALMDQLSKDDIRVRPIKLEECEVPPLLNHLKWVSLAKPESYKSGFKLIFETLLPKPEAESAVARLDSLLAACALERPAVHGRSPVSLSCPNCGGRAFSSNTEKKGGPSGYEYNKSIQCLQCGMLFDGRDGKVCPECNVAMIWSNLGGSEGGYGLYEDDYAWECPQCGKQVWW